MEHGEPTDGKQGSVASQKHTQKRDKAMAIGTIGDKSIDTNARTVTSTFECHEDEEAKAAKRGTKRIKLVLSYVDVSDVVIFAKASSADIIRVQNRIRGAWEKYSDGDTVTEDVATRRVARKLSAVDRARRFIADALGVSRDSIAADDARVAAALAVLGLSPEAAEGEEVIEDADEAKPHRAKAARK